jgi:hypothetical protein
MDIVNSNNQSVRTLIGYLPDATVGKDRLFDAYGSVGANLSVFSIVEDETLAIQGRPIPFDVNDQVPIGVRIPSQGTYSIAISAVDGLFAQNQTIYLEDNMLNSVHNLSQSPYSFTSDTGTFKDRFVIRYTTAALGNPNFENNTNVVVAVQNGQIKIKSVSDQIRSVSIYDLLGREIIKKNNISENEVVFQHLNIKNQALIVKIKLENGQIVTQKVIL